MSADGEWRRPLVLGVLALMAVAACGCSGNKEPMVERPNAALSPTGTAPGGAYMAWPRSRARSLGWNWWRWRKPPPAAGLYAVVQGELAGRILSRKLQRIASTGAEQVVTANPGCMMQIRAGVTLDWHVRQRNSRG